MRRLGGPPGPPDSCVGYPVAVLDSRDRAAAMMPRLVATSVGATHPVRVRERPSETCAIGGHDVPATQTTEEGRRMTPAQRRGVTLLASLTLATTALGGSVAAQSPSAAAPAGSPTTGGTIVMGEWQPASQFNPFFTTALHRRPRRSAPSCTACSPSTTMATGCRTSGSRFRPSPTACSCPARRTPMASPSSWSSSRASSGPTGPR